MSKRNKFELDKGDTVTLFNNTYKVLSAKGSEQTLLQDVKGVNFSMPHKKLEFLLSRSLAKSTSAELSPTEFVNAKKKALGVAKGQVAPLYTVYKGKMKVSMEPAKWVHTGTGKSYDGPEMEDAAHHHDLHHAADLDHALKFHKNIMTKTHPEDHDRLKKMVNEYLGKQRASINMKDVHKGWSSGGKQANKEQLESAFSLNAEATEHWNKFAKAYKASVKRVKTKG